MNCQNRQNAQIEDNGTRHHRIEEAVETKNAGPEKARLFSFSAGMNIWGEISRRPIGRIGAGTVELWRVT
jgi:hypothetical protein